MYEAELNQRKGEFDLSLFVCTGGLMAIGALFVYSAVSGYQMDLPWYKQMYMHQILWYVVGLMAAFGLLLADYSKLARWAPVFYGGSILMLLGVLVLGSKVNGARRWVTLGSFSLQPSEFAKIAFIFMLANFLSRPAEELRRNRIVYSVLGFTLVPFVLILKEPDLGSALVFPGISLAMMFASGIPARTLRLLVTGTGLLAALVVAAILFAPAQLKIESYQKSRLLTYFGVNKNKTETYNVDQALISVGSGGFMGKGWRHGTQYALGFLPRAGAHNDFIFSVIAEEEGFVGSVVVLALYAVLLFSGIKIASQARDHLGKLLAVGVVTLLFCHVFINIGMNIRIMPVAGIPLPLISYGGSSVVCSLIAIGILHNVHIYRRSY